MKIIVYRFNASKIKCEVFEEPHWDDVRHVKLCFFETKERYACSFEEAKFRLDLSCKNNEVMDYFYMRDRDYSKLTNLKNKVKTNA